MCTKSDAKVQLFSDICKYFCKKKIFAGIFLYSNLK